MQQLKNIIGGLDQVHKFMDRAEEKRRAYNSTNKPTKPLRARFKVWVKFLDGGSFIGYSLDYITVKGNSTLDEYEGLNTLYRQIYEWETKIKTVCIYASFDKHPLTKDHHYNFLIHKITPSIIEVNATVHPVNDGSVSIIPLDNPEIESRKDRIKNYTDAGRL